MSKMSSLSWVCTLWGVLAVTTAPTGRALPRVFLPAPEEPLPMVGSVCEDPTSFLALVLVMSHPDYVHKRRAMRDQYPDEEIATLGFRRAFVVGTRRGDDDAAKLNPLQANATRESDSLQANATRESDLLLSNSTDTYDSLANKALAAFKWAAENCPQARFIAKTDDDMFIDYYTLAASLGAVDDATVHAIRGHLHIDTINLSPYLAGGFYVTSPRTFNALVSAAETTGMFMHVAEDVYFTGVLANRVGAKRVDFGVVRHWEGAPHCCLDDVGGLVYHCQYAVFEDRRGMDFEHARRFKAHGRFCYFFECERFLGALVGKTGLTCFR